MTAAARQEAAGEKQSLREIEVEDLSAEQAGEELAALAAEIAHHDSSTTSRTSREIIGRQPMMLLRRRNDAIELRFPELKRGDSPSTKSVRHRRPGSPRSGTRFPCSRSATPCRRGCRGVRPRIRRFLNIKEGEPVEFVAEPKIDGLSARSATNTASWSWPPPVAMGRRARTSPPMCGPSATSQGTDRCCSDGWKCAARSIWTAPSSWS